ncbi:MAG: hydroxymethylbilane synthase [Candidatus Omnitrophota bacterium]|nr:hydroxymethylbilane synthase [Candidatus Omnitrophota bacterium]
MTKIFKFGTRPSPLALKQVEEVQMLLPRLRLETITIRTRGDRDKVSSLSHEEESDFFTREIERALLDKSIDVAVHSAKDLEADMPEELIIAATTSSPSPFECLVSGDNLSLEKLRRGAIVGTSSRRRREAIIRFRPDLIVKDIRGNIDERLKQLDDGFFDAIIVAHAALIRLGLRHRIAEIIPKEIMEPHPLQGRLAIQIRKDRQDLLNIFRTLNEN